MKVAIKNTAGKDTGKEIELSKGIFEIEPNDHAIYLDVKQHLANRRQGTHKAKERGEIKGSTRKIKRQKGTGTARAGSIKNPLFKGGGRVFGPRPRNYGFKLNKKVKRLARRSALAYKAKSDGIIVLDNFSMETPKTKEYMNVLKNLGVDSKKTLVVVPQDERNVYLSGRNLQNSRVVSADSLNTYDIMNAHCLVFSEGSVETINQILA